MVSDNVSQPTMVRNQSYAIDQAKIVDDAGNDAGPLDCKSKVGDQRIGSVASAILQATSSSPTCSARSVSPLPSRAS